MATFDNAINLTTTDGRSEVINVAIRDLIAIQINATAWGTAVAELKWSLDGKSWVSFSTAIEFSTSATGKRLISVIGVTYIRLETTTADASTPADDNAEVLNSVV